MGNKKEKEETVRLTLNVKKSTVQSYGIEAVLVDEKRKHLMEEALDDAKPGVDLERIKKEYADSLEEKLKKVKK